MDTEEACEPPADLDAIAPNTVATATWSCARCCRAITSVPVSTRWPSWPPILTGARPA